MLSRSAKAAYYAALGPAMALNGWLYRSIRAPSASAASPVRVHLGPGQQRYIPGWINVDANFITGKCDVWADLNNRLPFRDGTIDALYSHHVVEHLADLPGHLREAFRILKPGGVYRVGGPNGDSAIARFAAGDHAWFYDWPDRYESIGGRFVNFVLCRNEHLTLLTESFLTEIAGRAGFADGHTVVPTRETRYPKYFEDCLVHEHEENFDYPRTLLMEFVKAGKVAE